jgi:hypothetical protein
MGSDHPVGDIEEERRPVSQTEKTKLPEVVNALSGRGYAPHPLTVVFVLAGHKEDSIRHHGLLRCSQQEMKRPTSQHESARLVAIFKAVVIVRCLLRVSIVLATAL